MKQRHSFAQGGRPARAPDAGCGSTRAPHTQRRQEVSSAARGQTPRVPRTGKDTSWVLKDVCCVEGRLVCQRTSPVSTSVTWEANRGLGYLEGNGDMRNYDNKNEGTETTARGNPFARDYAAPRQTSVTRTELALPRAAVSPKAPCPASASPLQPAHPIHSSPPPKLAQAALSP